MKVYPDFLPELLNPSGNWEQKVIELYNVFLNDFVLTKCKYGNFSITYNKNRSIDNKEDCFWHLITKEDKRLGRIPDFRRAERIKWIKPIIENHTNSEIKEWDYLEGTGRIRKYLWLFNFDFIIILELGRNKKCYFLVTAFYVDKNKKYDLKRKFKKRIV